MSSLDKFPDWDAFSERPLPAPVELLSPASEAAAILQQANHRLEAAQREVAEVRRQGLSELAQQAVYVTQLAAALERYAPALDQAALGRIHRHLRVLKDQMLVAFTGAGMEIHNPLGEPFDAVVDRVHVEGWRHSPVFSAEVVAEVIEPVILHQGQVIRQGRVVMGAPEDQAEDQAGDLPEEHSSENSPSGAVAPDPSSSND
jgi:molecular chaperone GrpE (heat shock protein)